MLLHFPATTRSPDESGELETGYQVGAPDARIDVNGRYNERLEAADGSSWGPQLSPQLTEFVLLMFFRIKALPRVTHPTPLCRTILSLALSLILIQPLRSAEPEVHLQVIVAPRGPVDGTARWLETLKPLPFASLKLQSSQVATQPSIDQVDQGGSRRLNVIGVLTTRNELHLPGGRFRAGDRPGVAAWLTKLQSQPAAGEESRGQFGLTDRQRFELTHQLATRTDMATQGKTAAEVIDAIRRESRINIEIAPAATTALLKQQEVRDELSGVSHGTALAALLRSHDLALVPRIDDAGQLQITIDVTPDADESWPVGRPGKLPPPKTCPKLFETLPVEIQDIPLERALTAIQQRLEIPFLMDHRAIAVQQIELRQKVSIPPGKTTYFRVLTQLLFQARLKMELRVDENKRPLLWIEPISRR
jgi:hypothetical protein